jgi:hypothetical protein
MMYESRTQAPLSRARFARRALGHAAAALGVFVVFLGGGIAGYAHFEHLTLLDAFLNSAMLLGGMGPVDMPVTPGGKLFAGVYALVAGLVFIALAGLIVAPFAHRLLHLFHWDAEP